jgi:hypothetical protein
MSKPGRGEGQTQSRYKRWLLNLFILLLASLLLLALAETAMRWIDGYQLSTLQLEQDHNQK